MKKDAYCAISLCSIAFFPHRSDISSFFPVMITIEDIQAAAARINVHRTPILTNSTVNALASEHCGVPVELFFKCELLQKTGCKGMSR